MFMRCLVDSTRNNDGTFGKGNPGGPGRPRRWDRELRRAAAEAVTTEHVAAIMRRATRMALEGNLAAMRFVVERTCGRAVEVSEEPEPLAFDLPRMRTAADCDAAVQKIVDGIAKGLIPETTAKLLLDAVSARMKSIELNAHEQRLAELEKAAASVELPGRR